MPTEIETYTADLKAAVDFVKERVPSPEEWQRIVKSVEASKKAADEWANERRTRKSEDGKVRMRDGKFAGYTSLDFSMLAAVLDGRLRRRATGAGRALLDEAITAHKDLSQQFLNYEAVERWEDGAMSSLKSVTTNAKAARQECPTAENSSGRFNCSLPFAINCTLVMWYA